MAEAPICSEQHGRAGQWSAKALTVVVLTAAIFTTHMAITGQPALSQNPAEQVLEEIGRAHV